jgi:hypothetical protein
LFVSAGSSRDELYDSGQTLVLVAFVEDAFGLGGMEDLEAVEVAS